MAQIRRIRTVMTGVAGTPWYSNFYFTWVNGTESDHVDLVSAFWGSLANLIDNGVLLTIEGDTAVINDANGEITGVEVAAPGSVAGTATDAALPPATQAIGHLLTGTFVGGRQVRGRCFVPGLTIKSNTTAGSLLNTSQSTLQASFDDLIADSGTPGPLRVLSRVHASSYIVDAAVVPVKFAVLRSRRD